METFTEFVLSWVAFFSSFSPKELFHLFVWSIGFGTSFVFTILLLSRIVELAEKHSISGVIHKRLTSLDKNLQNLKEELKKDESTSPSKDTS